MEDFPKLINSRDEAITINNSSFSIGRSLSCDHIIQSLGVSRFHCIIKKNDDKWTLFDRSTNGTFVNYTLYKFNESVDLKNGDVIKLGDFDFTFTSPKSVKAPMEAPNEDSHLIEDTEILTELQQPFELEVVSEEPKKPEIKIEVSEQSLDMMKNELTCSICSELFIKAVTLNCSHTYCKYCIEEWKKNKSTCPICRTNITNVAPTIVLDNFIEKFISTQSEEMKQTRKALVQQRTDILVNTASSSNIDSGPSNVIEGGQIIEIFSEDEDEDEDSDYNNYSSDDHDYDGYDCYLDGPPFVGSHGRYYGGYGRCFICNQTGHWANSCPFKRR